MPGGRKISSAGEWRNRLRAYRWQRKSMSSRILRSVPSNGRPLLSSGRLRGKNDSFLPSPVTVKGTPSLNTTKISSCVILSIVEGRGLSAGEVGLATLDLYCPNIEISQFRDTSSYRRALVKLLVLAPSEIIVPNTALEPNSSMRKLVRVLHSFRTSSTIIGVSRMHFNDKQGLSNLQRLCHPEYLSSIYAIREKYYALSAASALLHYVEDSHGLLHAPHSLRFAFTGSVQTTMIDVKSACRLRLVENAWDHSTKDTLFAAVNNTCTPGGAKLLRANLLEPPCDLATTVNRQAAIAELASSPEMLLNVQNILRQFPYIDGLLSLCVQMCTTPPTPITYSVNSQTKGRIPGLLERYSSSGINRQSTNCSNMLSPAERERHSSKCDVACTSLRPTTSLSPLPCVSSCLSTNSNIKSMVNLQAIESRMTRIIAIKNMLDLVRPLSVALAEASSGLLKTFRELLCDTGYENTLKKLCTVLHEDVRMSKGMLAMRSQKCFAIKEGLSIVLDVTRKAYSEQLDDITVEVSQLAQRYSLPLRVAHNKVRGFYIQVPQSVFGDTSEQEEAVPFADEHGLQSDELQPEYSESNDFDGWTESPKVSPGENKSLKNLPAEFVKIYVSRGIIHCTTESLVCNQHRPRNNTPMSWNGGCQISVMLSCSRSMRLNERMKGSLHEVYFIADQIMCDLIAELQPDMGLFYRLSEVIASLDLLASFARLIVSSPANIPFVCPQFTDRLAIKNGRNISIDFQSNCTSVPNHTYASPDLSLTVISGPSMSGRTTYLRQIAYTQILSQMREMSYILRNATGSSLVLVDGLCQGTSPWEAENLSWAICTALLDTKAFTFVATQWRELTQLADYHPNVENCYFLVEEEPSPYVADYSYESPSLHGDNKTQSFDTTSCNISASTSVSNGSSLFPTDARNVPTRRAWRVHLNFTYKLLKGVPERRYYGLEIARLTSLPEKIIVRAEELLKQLTDTNVGSPPNFRTDVHEHDGIDRELVSRSCETEELPGREKNEDLMSRCQSTVGIPSDSVRSCSGDLCSSKQCRLDVMAPSAQVTHRKKTTSEASPINEDENGEEKDKNGHASRSGEKLTAKDHLTYQLLRQLALLSKPLNALSNSGGPDAKYSVLKNELLGYIRFLKNRYKQIIDRASQSEEQPLGLFSDPRDTF
ncbi:unnamed protein product [Calicophoron daubneyi]|uniref:Uncharacterized protein n=1 Tax=Calicophoron daubneyi TaxID=300641 RepID=A0AAV2THL7_CALDB